eukprot:2825148-Amphidinium_carterae.1
MIFEACGLPIGGVASTAALAVALGFQEWQLCSDSDFRDAICTLGQALQLAYPLKASACSGLPGMTRPHIWADIEFVPIGFAVLLRAKSVNKQWLLGPAQFPVKLSFQPWPGVLPMQSHSALISEGSVVGLIKLKLGTWATFICGCGMSA